MLWCVSDRFDPRALPIADRHYNRQKPGTPQFVPPGGCFVLLTESQDALWVSSFPLPQFVKHEWAGAWMNSCFRNENPERYLSSELILQAVAATRYERGEPPDLGMVTFINPEKVRRKRDWGRCYRKAGFVECENKTKGGLIALQLLPEHMPPSEPVLGATLRLIA